MARKTQPWPRDALIDKLSSLNACGEAISFIGKHRSGYEAWKSCLVPGWIMWLASWTMTRKEVALFLSQFVRPLLEKSFEKDDYVHSAFKMALNKARGKPVTERAIDDAVEWLETRFYNEQWGAERTAAGYAVVHMLHLFSKTYCLERADVAAISTDIIDFVVEWGKPEHEVGGRDATSSRLLRKKLGWKRIANGLAKAEQGKVI